MRNYGIRQVQTTARILLICPECGQENSEFAEALRRISTFYCSGEDCDYIFDLAPGRPSDVGRGFIDACRRFYAAFYTVRGERAR
jgi:rubredoxin